MLNQRQQQQTPNNWGSMRESFHIAYFVSRTYATCFIVFTRHTFGVEVFGWYGPCALLLILLYAGVAEAPEMLAFFLLWFTALVIQRARTMWVIWHGVKMHSQDGGRLWLGSLLPFMRSHRRAAVVEVLTVLTAGSLLTDVSEPLGRFVFYGGWALAIVHAIECQTIVMETRRMQDAEIEMRMRTEYYQGRDQF